MFVSPDPTRMPPQAGPSRLMWMRLAESWPLWQVIESSEYCYSFASFARLSTGSPHRAVARQC